MGCGCSGSTPRGGKPSGSEAAQPQGRDPGYFWNGPQRPPAAKTPKPKK